jgi:hypothetical protein
MRAQLLNWLILAICISDMAILIRWSRVIYLLKINKNKNNQVLKKKFDAVHSSCSPYQRSLNGVIRYFCSRCLQLPCDGYTRWPVWRKHAMSTSRCSRRCIDILVSGQTNRTFLANFTNSLNRHRSLSPVLCPTNPSQQTAHVCYSRYNVIFDHLQFFEVNYIRVYIWCK